MRWVGIAKAWMQIVAKVAVARSSMRDANSIPADAARTAPSVGDFYNEPGITPYRPKNRIERSDFSQHLSC
jgi:hypothetical protein